MRQLGNSKVTISLSISQAVTAKAELTAGYRETISQSSRERLKTMPNALDKLMEAYEELAHENKFLQAKAKYFKQTALAQDVSLNLARKELVELKSEMRVLKASTV